MVSRSPNLPVLVLLCGKDFPDGLRFTREFLQQHSQIQVHSLEFAEAARNIHKYDICVPRMMKLDASLISQAKNTKIICQFGVGLEGVDIQAATRAGIKVGRIPGNVTGNSLSCAEHAIYLMLALLRDQKGMENTVAEGKIGFPTGHTLFGKTVFIVGYGNIGKELAMRLTTFGVRILAIKRSWSKKNSSLQENPLLTDTSMTSKSRQLFQYFKENEDLLVDEKGGQDVLYEFASQADIVVFSCHLTLETTGMVNDRFVTSLKKGAFIVNVGRGELLDYEAVKRGLDSGHIGGLASDVAWQEPLDPDDPILKHPKVLLTPHVAGVTQLAHRKTAKVIAECALELSSGSEDWKNRAPSLLEYVN